MLDALERADAGILCVQPLQGELGARMEIVSVVERRRIRYAHMVGVTPQIMRQGMRADYRLVDELSQRLCERMRAGAAPPRRNAGGHAFSADVRSRAGLGEDQRADQSALLVEPAGRRGVHHAGERRRHLRLRRHGRRLFRPKYGDLRATPLTLEIAGGRLQAAGCSRTDLEREFWDYCHTDEHSDRVGELAFGTNIAL